MLDLTQVCEKTNLNSLYDKSNLYAWFSEESCRQIPKKQLRYGYIKLMMEQYVCEMNQVSSVFTVYTGWSGDSQSLALLTQGELIKQV